MRAQMRRMPAERVRHAKRLGHVQQGSGPAFPVLAAADNGNGNNNNPKPTTTTSQKDTTTQATPTTTTAKQSSTTSASTPTHSSASTTSTTLTSQTASSTNGHSTTATTLMSSMTAMGSTMPTLTMSTTPTSLATTTPVTNVVAAKSTGLSSGGIVGIVAGAAVVGVALIVFFIRKTALRRRANKRISWSRAPGFTGGAFPSPTLPELSEKPEPYPVATSVPQRSEPVVPFEPYMQPAYAPPAPPVMRMQTPNIPTYAPPAPPPPTFNNPTQYGPYPGPSVTPAYATDGTAAALALARAAAGSPGNVPLPPVRGPQAPVETSVNCTFVPSLPDELSITTGERVYVIARYDDGWALCANGRGEQGMVPQECLDAPSSIDWGNGRRLSSLNADGRSY